ncbi:MAG TPA: RNA polymerase sigma-70 factor [Gemmatimonadaceae bacterium]
MATPCPSTTDRDLVARIRAGDAGAFEQLFRAYYEELCDLAARMLGSDALAEEIVQDTFFHLWRMRERWEIGSTLQGYLRITVRNRVLNHVRRQRLERRWVPRLATDDEIVSLCPEARRADDDAASHELADAIRRAVAELPPRCREAFLLRRERNLSYAEIAAIMHTAPRTVEAQIRNAQKMLRKRLGDWL